MNRSPSTSSFNFGIESSGSPSSRVAFHSRSPDRVLDPTCLAWSPPACTHSPTGSTTPSTVACVVAISFPVSILLRSDAPFEPSTHATNEDTRFRLGSVVTLGPVTPPRYAWRSEERPWRRLSSLAGMNLSLSQCFVIVHDPEPALAFCRDALGLEQRSDVGKGEFQWITVGAASHPPPPPAAPLAPPAPPRGAPPPRRRARRPRGGGGGGVAFKVVGEDDRDVGLG